MTLVVAPGIISAGRAWVRVLDRGRGRTAVGYLGLVGLVRALVRLAGRSLRRLVHPLLGTGPVTGSAGVMHRTSRPFTSPRSSLHRRASTNDRRRAPRLCWPPRLARAHRHFSPRPTVCTIPPRPGSPELTRAQRGPGWMMDRVRQGRTVSPPSGQLSRAFFSRPRLSRIDNLSEVYVFLFFWIGSLFEQGSEFYRVFFFFFEQRFN